MTGAIIDFLLDVLAVFLGTLPAIFLFFFWKGGGE